MGLYCIMFYKFCQHGKQKYPHGIPARAFLFDVEIDRYLESDETEV